MLAVDTNLVIRYLTGEDPDQTKRARSVIDRQDVLVTSTVILETEWVLRTVYRFAPAQIGNAIEAFAGLPHVKFDQPARLAQALAWFRSGLDFADALHLAGAEECEAFLTFDQEFVRSAKSAGTPPVRYP